ncbi:uncharacterized protein LOC107725867 [Sinocyclocheilus rhinocerous]|uniref:uncharacterized protein LOC107725867 n=1 Tax=Sinocyclocheilus rhinocerous TaxID=307959 RepID=UPI0007BAD830|nr:PREDICTED: uncharacterized protein LOC107725867 [Sinocyclocheilus rhinocerous]
MILRLFICFSVLMVVTEGAAVKVHPGGNTTLPCSIKNDTEINWIITNGNQTFVRILKLEYLYGGKFKPEPSIIHPSYAGRITALISPINTHSLLLMNITDTDLILYCCMDFTLEQSHCTKLDYQDFSIEDVDQDTDTISHESEIVLWLPVVCVLLLLLLVSCVYVCWRGTGLWKGCGRTNNLNQDWIHNSAQGKLEQDDWTLADVFYTLIP